MSIDKLKTKFFTGAWLTDVKHYFSKINEIIDYLNGTSGNGSYKIYSGLITQDGTPGNPPTIIILENTLGNLTLSYSVPGAPVDGNYSFFSNGLFTVGKTFLQIGSPSDVSSSIYMNQANINEISIITLSSGIPSPGLVNNTSVEIRVYN